MLDLPTHLRLRLRPQSPVPETKNGIRAAAVLLPLYKTQDEWYLLFTRRTERVEAHRGQVSFPGGLIEVGETPTEAACRETEEETGIVADAIDVLGAMKPLPTVTGFIIAPIVGIIPWPYPLKLHRVEVAKVFGVPLGWLQDPENLQTHHWRSSPEGDKTPIHAFLPFEGEVIWGATARITLNFLSLMNI